MTEPHNLSIPFDQSLHENWIDYRIEDRPGGTRIYRAKLTDDPTASPSGKVYLVKVVPTASISFRKPHNPRNEAAILSKLSHPNIINLASAQFQEEREVYELRMPYIELPLLSILDNPWFSAQPFPSGILLPTESPFPTDAPPNLHEILSKSIIFQIVSAVAYLHTREQPIAHRDITPGNILLTYTGVVKLVDFGVSWDPSLKDIHIPGEGSLDEDIYWKEDPLEMCAQVATGPYRAPELMYSSPTYDPYAADLWALGVLVSLFFSPLELYLQDDGEDAYSEDSSNSGHKAETHKAPQTPAFMIPSMVSSISPRDEWIRKPLFDSSTGEIGLLWSIFRTMGTPTDETWPDFPGNRPGSMIKFKEAPKQELAPLLPHLPEDPNQVLGMIEGFLAYPPVQRLKATKALGNEWFNTGVSILLPKDYNLVDGLPKSVVRELDGHDCTSILRVLVESEREEVEQNATLRDEWD